MGTDVDAGMSLSAAQRFEVVADHSPDLVILIDGSGVIVRASGGTSRFGWDPSELVGRSAIGLGHPADRITVEHAARAAHGSSTDTVEIRVRHPAGNWVWCELTMREIEDADGARALFAVLRDVSDRRSAEMRLARMAHTDALTGLPNRARLIERLSRALRRNDAGPVSVLFIDLDGFKRVNDTLGHPAGDELLCHASERLRAALRPNDELFRLGGDEFVALCTGTDRDGAEAVGERLRTALADPFRLGESLTRATASLGVRVVGTGRDVTPDQILRDADTAMYVAKERGRNRVAVFSPELRADLLRRVELAEALHESLEDDHLRLVYQPVVDLLDGRVLGVEALLRWDHPTEGPVAPDEIVAIAQETGQVERLDSWVLDHAVDQLGTWRAAGVDLSFLSVNVCFGSPEQLRLADVVADIRSSGRLGRTALVLELTEGSLLESDAEAELVAVRDQGVYLAVDDFGTGHSSLARLQQLPIDMLKVDRSFVDGLGTETHDSAIVTSVLELAATMGLHVVAEGVETGRQAAMLLGLGCRAVQGFAFSKPKPPDHLAPALRSGYRRLTNQLARMHRPDMARDRLRAAAHDSEGAARREALRGKRRLIDEMQYQLGIEVS